MLKQIGFAPRSMKRFLKDPLFVAGLSKRRS